MPLEPSQIDRTLTKLETWINHNGWHGYDPYDIRGTDWYRGVAGGDSWASRKFRRVLHLVERQLPPLALRRVLGIEREINPKGMGLLAGAYLTLYRTTRSSHYLEQAQDILGWLKQNACKEHAGMSWGYPFHWQSRVLIPRGTPSSVVTCVVGSAWIDHFEITGSGESLDVANEIATFLLSGLSRPVNEPGRICFSYTPIDHFKVLNANMFAASFLARLGALTKKSEYTDVALSATMYTVSEQNRNGSFYYWGSGGGATIDHYHTGFVLRHLDSVRHALGGQACEDALLRGYAFYRENLFTQDGIPKFTPTSQYPINVHSCAEAILCLSQLPEARNDCSLLKAVCDFTCTEMSTPEGWFIYEIRRTLNGTRRIEIPYMRWGQAWMLLALSKVQNALLRH